MSLPVPPKYIVVPLQVIEQAYQPDKPRRALFASFVRILSLAWENKYERTPLLNEQELWEFLKLSRRQYFEQKADMELLGWLRSSHPVPGFVQFAFSRMIAEPVALSAEKLTAGAESRTVLKRIEEEESTEFLNTESSSSSSLKQNEVRKIALAKGARKTIMINDAYSQKIKLLVENLHLAFDPKDYGLLDLREEFLVGIPERMLGWIAKAYQDRLSLKSPIGFIVTHILNQDAPHQYFIDNFRRILPAEYLEAIGEFEIECEFCTERFPSRALKDEHRKAAHQHHCDECGSDFATAELLKEHFLAEHDLHRVRKTAPAFTADPEAGSEIECTWQKILEALSQEMPRASFDTWVRDTAPICYDGNALVIGARNAYARDWLENRLADKVKKILAGILGRDVVVTFEVSA